MSEFKTLAYDHVKLYGPKKLSFKLEELLPDKIDHSYVNISRELMKKVMDDHKVLYEFVAEVLQKRDFTNWDIVWYYQRRIRELEEKGRNVIS